MEQLKKANDLSDRIMLLREHELCVKRTANALTPGAVLYISIHEDCLPEKLFTEYLTNVEKKIKALKDKLAAI